MDILFELLKQLSESMSLGTFLLVLVIIGLSSVIVGTFIARNSTKKTGFWAIFRSDEKKESKELSDVRATVVRLQELLIRHAEVEKDDKQTIKDQLERSLLLKDDIESTRDAILKEIENTKYIIKLKDEHSILVQENISSFLQKLSEQLTKASSQIDKVDEIARDMGTEFRADHKDLTKSLSDLSKDVALIERTIQTQINTIGVKLRQ
jgi:hypothetical protein